MAAAWAEQEWRWIRLSPDTLMLKHRQDFPVLPVMRVYKVADGSDKWAADTWGADPFALPPHFDTVEEAKTYCEVTVKLCGS